MVLSWTNLPFLSIAERNVFKPVMLFIEWSEPIYTECIHFKIHYMYFNVTVNKCLKWNSHSNDYEDYGVLVLNVIYHVVQWKPNVSEETVASVFKLKGRADMFRKARGFLNLTTVQHRRPHSPSLSAFTFKQLKRSKK